MTTNVNSKASIAAMFSVGAVWFTTHAGAGFATGNQAWQYYAVYGLPGMIFPLISMGLLALVLREAMIMSKLTGSNNYGELMKNLFKPYDKLYLTFEVFYYCIVLAAVGGVISAATGMVQDVIPMPAPLATIIIGILLLVLIIFGADLVRRVASILGILIIVSGFTIYIIGIIKSGSNITEVVSTGYAPQGWLYPFWRAIIYCGFQCVALPAMVACCGNLNNKKGINGASFFGFIMNGFGVALTVWMLIGWRSGITTPEASKLPTLYVCQQLGISVLFYFYSICLFCCLISTGVSCIFGIVVRLENSIFTKSKGIMENILTRRIFITVLAILVCMGISAFGLSNIVSIGYQYCGYVAIVFCVIPFLTIGYKKNRQMMKENPSLLG